MEQITRMRDNRTMLQKVNNSKMQNIFIQPDLSQIQFNSQIIKQDFSPPKQKIQDELLEVNNDLKYVKHKIANFSKWDSFKPYSFPKLPNDEKDHIFQTLFQDFLAMKNFYNEYVDKYTKLSTKLHRLENEISKFNKNKLTGPEKVKVYTEQNKQNKELRQEIKRLNQKIIALTSSKPTAQTRPKTSHNNKTLSATQSQQKAIFPVTQNLKVELQIEKKHVKQLLQVIDELRRQKMMLEMQIKQKNLNQSIQKINLKPGQRPGKGRMGTNQSMFSNEDRFKQYTDELLMWKQKAHDMQLCFNKMSEDKDRVINELKRQLVQVKEGERMRKNMERTGMSRPNIDDSINEGRIRELEESNYKLEGEIKSLLRNPLFKDNNQAVDLKKANKELEDAIKALKQQLLTVKQDKTKYLSQLDLKSKQSEMLKLQNTKLKRQVKDYVEKEIKSSNTKNQLYKYDQNDYYRKMLHLVKLQGDDPVWKKYSDMVMPVFTVMTQSQLTQTAESLWKTKLQLLAHLQKAQVQLKTNKQTNGSKLNLYIQQKQRLQEQLRVTKARLDQWMTMDRVTTHNRDYQIHLKQGIKYNDSISVFEDEQDELKALEPTQNYFDLFLGQINLDQTNVLRHPQNKIKSISNIISFLTIDFYNHPTQHSHFAEGLTKKLMNNFSYKVEVNSYLVKFISKNSISIELWSPQGTSNVQFGKGQIWLSDLLVATAKDVSNVVRGKCPIYTSNKMLIATVEYRMRMRLPISPFMEWANNKEQLNKYVKSDPFAINQRKKLGITIERAEGLKSSGNTFVYFTIQNEDFFTEPCEGNSPFWDYHREIDVVLDQDFSGYLKENYVQFTLFDDDKEVNEDVVGIAKANLTSLLESTHPLELVLDIEDTKSSIVGKLKVKAFWV